MSRPHFRRVKSLFRQALEIAPEQRDSFMAEHCDDDVTRRDLQALIDAHENASSFLASPLQPTTVVADPLHDQWIGRVVAGFQLEQIIGTGGYATVYRAIQQRPLRTVALKLMHRRRTDPACRKRFRDESDVLARLDHPGIAKVFASGRCDDYGEPRDWIAMEWIAGLSLDQYVAGRDLDLTQKLMLLHQICLAVSHAHERRIVHRDLKPTNILVKIEDRDVDQADPRPVIVDFGIARDLGHSISDRTSTSDGTVLGTFTHMSPEQLAGEIGRVNAASDVYALGVIGYELLSGRPPLDMKRGSLRDVIERGINEEPTLLGKIDRRFRGDLEVIFATALAKDQACRYVSAAALAQDLDDYLNGRSISVKRPSVWTRGIRFIRRNRGPVAAASGILCVAMAGAVFYFDAARRARIQAANATYEAEKATAVNSFITNDLMTNLISGMTDPSDEPRDRVASILDQTAAKTNAMFGDRPVIEAAVRNELGTMWYNLGKFTQAKQEYAHAGKLWREAVGDQHADTLKAANNLALCLMHLGEGEQAESLFRKTLQARRDVLGDDHEQTLATMNNLAEILGNLGQLDESQQLLTEAYDRQLRVAGFENKQSLIIAANLGTLMIKRGDPERALQLHRDVYSGCQAELGEQHVTTRHAGFRYAQTLYTLKQYDDALKVLKPIHGMTEHSLSPEAMTVARLLSRIQRNRGDSTEAKQTLQHALDAAQSKPDEFQTTIQKLERDLSRL